MFTQLRREMLMAIRSRRELMNPLLFFVMITSLLPLAVGADPALLQRLAAGMIWVMALLSSLLSLDYLFRSDYDDGSLDQMLLLPQGIFWPILGKVICHWCVTGLLLTLLSPMLAVMFSLPASLYPMLMISLMLGTLYFSFIGAIGSALTVCLRRGGLLLTLIIMPLYIPVLILGAGVGTRALEGYNMTAPLLALASLAAFAIAFAPLAIAAALRISADD